MIPVVRSEKGLSRCDLRELPQSGLAHLRMQTRARGAKLGGEANQEDFDVRGGKKVFQGFDFSRGFCVEGAQKNKQNAAVLVTQVHSCYSRENRPIEKRLLRTTRT